METLLLALVLILTCALAAVVWLAWNAPLYGPHEMPVKETDIDAGALEGDLSKFVAELNVRAAE